jgi:pimeloyl-ACP methyl ester carboxylesterase
MYSVKYQKPTNYHQLTEGVRTLQDIQDYLMWQNFLLTRPKLSKNTKPIIVVPGFLADDDSTLIIRGVLKHLGANVQGWGLGTNFGVRVHLITGLAKLIRKVSDETNQKVTLIGHSLGGVFSKELAKMFPTHVEQVISLGSPLFDKEGESSSISEIYKMFNPNRLDEKLLPIEHKFEDNFEQLPKCLMTSIYSKADGIVHWEASLLPKGKLTQNIEVDCSHCGMANAPAVIYLLTRLVEHSSAEKFTPNMLERLFIKDGDESK